MTGIVLAGGENRRMGRDKAFLEFRGRPLVERAINVLKGICSAVIVVANSPEGYAPFGVTVVPDAFGIRGPLTGIYTGMTASDDEHHIVVACDMPFLHAGLLAFMAREAVGYDAAVPRIGAHLEPLHAVYHRRLLPDIGVLLHKDQRRIQELFEGKNIRFITESEIDRYDPLHRSFINLNTPQEYQEASCSDWECRN